MADYKETVDYILAVPLFAQKIGKDRLSSLLCRLGNPEKAVPCVHVAGTNGKGSTCKAIMQLMNNAGYKVGLFISPHLVSINERIQINGINISDDDFTRVFETVKSQFREHPSFFELMFAMAAVYFKEQGCDFAVYETGMGGRLDATNVVTPLISVITSVGMDHMQYLGDTIYKIAEEKAGIIKPEVPVLYFKRDETASSVIEKTAIQRNSKAISVEKQDYIINHLGNKTIDFSLCNRYYKYCNLVIRKTSLYQLENVSLAVICFSMLMERYSRCAETEEIIRRTLPDFFWEGRMEQLAPHIYVDGAHNVEAVRAYIETVNTLYAGGEKLLLFAAVKDKEYEEMIELLLEGISFKEIIITSAGGSRRTSPESLAELFRSHTDAPVYTRDSIEDAMDMAYDRLMNKKVTDIFCVGSLYLVGGVKKWRKEHDQF